MGFECVPCSIYRGGTSKAVLLRGTDLPEPGIARDHLILQIFGSPDVKQINGLGGGTPTTSKVGIVEVSSRPDADVDFTFGQVSLDRPYVDYRPNCGNISSAVGPFALEHGMVQMKQSELMRVRIYNTNTDSVIVSQFQVRDKHFEPEGNTVIPGVPGSGSAIYLDFLEKGGRFNGKLFPTGRVKDRIFLFDGKAFDVTIVDVGNLTVLLDGMALGMNGTEVKEEDLSGALVQMEAIRKEVGIRLGIFHRDACIDPGSHALPKVAFVTNPVDYCTLDQSIIRHSEYDIAARVLTMGRLHPSYAITGGMALAAASKIPGTIPYEKIQDHSDHRLRIGHPSGILVITADVDSKDLEVNKITLVRTARPLMDGHVWVSMSNTEVKS